MTKIPALCIVGPTASGKTGLAIRLAHALDGEIINMDSMQIYRRMDIGTAKPTLTQRENVPHHLLDIVEPTDSFTVAQYADLADVAIRAVYRRGRLPIVTGGTGFYLRALTDGLRLGGVQSDPAIRERLKATAEEPNGKQKLHARLLAVDPQSAAKLHENDVQRVCRALEVFELTGQPISGQMNAREEQPYRFCILGTTLERSALYARTDARVEAMFGKGLPDEVRALLDSGVPPQAQAMQGIGYKELVPVFRARVSLEEAKQAVKLNTRHYAKRQWTWFRAIGDIAWIDMQQPTSYEDALRISGAFWEENRT